MPLAIAAVVTAIVGLQGAWRARQEENRPLRMCEGLPAYEELDARIPRGAAVVFTTDDPTERQGERFFCVRYALAPRLVSRPSWPRVTNRIAARAWRVSDEGGIVTVTPPPPLRRQP